MERLDAICSVSVCRGGCGWLCCEVVLCVVLAGAGAAAAMGATLLHGSGEADVNQARIPTTWHSALYMISDGKPADWWLVRHNGK